MKRFMAMVAMGVALCQFGAAAEVLVDDFMNRFTGGPDSGNFNQTDLGEAYGMASQYNTPDSGGGNWVIYHDTLGTTITNGSGADLNPDSVLPKSAFPFDSSLKKPVLHLIMHPERASKADFSNFGTGFPWGGFEADFPGDSSKYFDLSKMSAVKIKVKGVAKRGFRVSIVTQALMQAGAWGYHGMNIALDTAWNWITIDTAQLKAALDDPLAVGFTWDSVKTHCKALAFDAITGDTKANNVDSAEIYIDSIILAGIDTFANSSIKSGLLSRTDHASMLRASVSGKMITISYSLKTSGNVAIDIVNASGRKVMDLVKCSQSASSVVSKSFSAAALPAGVYFIRASLAGSVLHKKISIIK